MYNDLSKSSQIANSTEPDHPTNLGIIVDPHHIDVCVPRPPMQPSSQPSAFVMSKAIPHTLHPTPTRKKKGLRRHRVSCSTWAIEEHAA